MATTEQPADERSGPLWEESSLGGEERSGPLWESPSSDSPDEMTPAADGGASPEAVETSSPEALDVAPEPAEGALVESPDLLPPPPAAESTIEPPTATIESAAAAAAAATVAASSFRPMETAPMPPPSFEPPPPMPEASIPVADRPVGADDVASSIPRYQPQIVEERKDPSTGFLLELIPGLFGFLGIGYLYAGRTNDGIIRLAAFLIYNLLAWTAIAVLSIIVVGLCLIPVQLAIQIGVPIWSALQLRKEMEMAGPYAPPR